MVIWWKNNIPYNACNVVDWIKKQHPLQCMQYGWLNQKTTSLTMHAIWLFESKTTSLTMHAIWLSESKQHPLQCMQYGCLNQKQHPLQCMQYGCPNQKQHPCNACNSYIVLVATLENYFFISYILQKKVIFLLSILKFSSQKWPFPNFSTV